MITFKDENRQAEFEAFAAFYALVAKRPFTASKRSLINQLHSIANAQFGGGAASELSRANPYTGIQTEQPASERRLGKPGGDERARRGSSPNQSQPNNPAAKAREARIAARQVQESRSAAPAVVAADSLVNTPPKIAVKQPELKQVQLSTGATFDVDEGRTSDALPSFVDAANFSAKELVEKYGRDVIYEYLLSAGYDADNLSDKTDRQLANLLKKQVSEKSE